MNENNTTLRQAINSVSIVGYLKKMDLKKGESKKPDGSNGEYVSGNMVIETAPHNEITVNVYINRMSKGNDKNPPAETTAYKGILRVMDEYVSMASLMEKGLSEEEAHAQCTKVSVNRANLDINDYWSERNNSFITSVRVKAQYFNRITNDSFEPCARFDVEGFIYAKKPEFKGTGDDVTETGRLKLTMMVPGYGGNVMPMEFVTDAGVSNYIDDHYNVGDTVRVYGNMVNSVNIVKTRKPGIKEEYDVSTTYVNEMLIDNGIPEPYDEENANHYKRDAIEAAVRVRNTETLPKKKQDQLNREASKNSTAPANGFASAGFASGNAPKASPFHF